MRALNLRAAFVVFFAASLSGCAVITVVDTAASVTGTVVEAGVDLATAPVDLLVGEDAAEKEEDE